MPNYTLDKDRKLKRRLLSLLFRLVSVDTYYSIFTTLKMDLLFN